MYWNVWTWLILENFSKIYKEKLCKYSLKLYRVWIRHSIGKAFTIKICVIVYFTFSIVLHWTQTKIIFLLLWRLNVILIILFHLYFFLQVPRTLCNSFTIFYSTWHWIARAYGQEKEIKGIQIEKEEVNRWYYIEKILKIPLKLY